jgi:hypothetical protein
MRALQEAKVVLTVADSIRLQVEMMRAQALKGMWDHDPLLKAMILAQPEAKKMARKLLKAAKASKKTRKASSTPARSRPK